MRTQCTNILALAFFAFAASISPTAAADILAIGGWSLTQSRDQRSGTKGYGVEGNTAVGFFNLSFSLRHWQRDVTLWNDRSVNNEGSIYVGVGLLDLIEIQRGYSSTGPRTRVRVDISLSDEFPFPGEQKWGRFQEGIVLTPYVESQNGRKVYGLGVGLVFQ